MAKWLYYTKHFPQPEMGGGRNKFIFFEKRNSTGEIEATGKTSKRSAKIVKINKYIKDIYMHSKILIHSELRAWHTRVFPQQRRDR
jgi:hypothetical protein